MGKKVNQSPPAPKTAEEKRDFATAQKLKPALRKFVQQKLVNDAAKHNQDRQAKNKKYLNSQEIFDRVSLLSARAFHILRLWKHHQPPIEMAWIKLGTTTPKLRQEMEMDIVGFAIYLAKAYEKYQETHGEFFQGRNPLDDEHVFYFWVCFCRDLPLLIEADRRRVEAGNKGAILVDPKEKKIES